MSDLRQGAPERGNTVSLESDIERLKLQEQKLRFEKLDEADAWKLGSLMRDAAIARKLTLVIDIRVAGRPLFYVALPARPPTIPIGCGGKSMS